MFRPHRICGRRFGGLRFHIYATTFAISAAAYSSARALVGGG
jgi:hypothetical protein